MDYLFRKANFDDIDFITETIIEAEKSGSNVIGLCQILDLSERQLSDCIKSILKEEIDGCEFSISSFLVAEFDKCCVAAVGGWLEGENDYNLSSSLIKASLFASNVPKENLRHLTLIYNKIKDLVIERKLNTYQLEYVYVRKEHRGRALVKKLIDQHLCEFDKIECFVQVFANNKSAIHTYLNCNFELFDELMINESDAIKYFPDFKKLVLRKLYEKQRANY